MSSFPTPPPLSRIPPPALRPPPQAFEFVDFLGGWTVVRGYCHNLAQQAREGRRGVVGGGTSLDPSYNMTFLSLRGGDWVESTVVTSIGLSPRPAKYLYFYFRKVSVFPNC